jgi:hypothetical protein
MAYIIASIIILEFCVWVCGGVLGLFYIFRHLLRSGREKHKRQNRG